MMGKCSALFVVVTCVVVHVPGYYGSTIGSVEGSLFVKNDHLFEGDILEMNCTVDPSEMVTANDIYFNESGHVIPSKHISVSDSHTATLKITPPKNRTSECIRYTCYVKQNDSKTDLIIIDGEKCIFLEKRPRAVQESDVRWIVEDWRNMTGVVDLGMSNKEMKRINITWEWSRDNGCIAWSLCPHVSKQNTTCSWLEYDGNDSLNFLNHCIEINVTNIKLGVTESSGIMVVDPTRHVKPAPITQLSTVAVSSHCVNISWQYPGHRRKMYMVKVLLVEREFLKKRKTKKKSVKICSLKPYTVYRVSVYCLPAGIYKGYPSAGVTQLVTTLQDVPDEAPELFPGGYEELPSPNSSCRLISLYHQENDVKNGEITGYKLTVSELGDNSQSSQQMFVKVPQEICLPPNQYYYRITMNSRTKVGFSKKPSSMVIASKSEVSAIKQSLNFHVQLSNTTENGISVMKANWDSKQKYHSYTVFYCKGSLMDRCKNVITAQTIAANENQIDIKIPTGLYTEYIFGLSVQMVVNGEVISPGIEWAWCIYNERGVIKVAPKNFRYRILQKLNRGFEVMWDKYLCDSLETTAFVEGYSINYCQTKDNTNCTGKKIMKKTQHPLQNYLIVREPDLQSGVSYLVQGRAFSNTSLSPVSSWLLVEIPATVESSNTIKVIAGVTGSALLLAVLVFAGFKVRNMKKSDQHKVKLPDELQMEKSESSRLYHELDDLQNSENTTSDLSTDDRERQQLVSRNEYIHRNTSEEKDMDDSLNEGPLTIQPYNRVTDDTILEQATHPVKLSNFHRSLHHHLSSDNLQLNTPLATAMPVHVFNRGIGDTLSDETNSNIVNTLSNSNDTDKVENISDKKYVLSDYVTQIPTKLQDLNQNRRVSHNSSMTDDNTDAPVSRTSTDCNEYVTQIQSNLRNLNPNRRVSHNSSMTGDNTDVPVSQTSTDCNEYVTQIQSNLQDFNPNRRVSHNSSMTGDNTDAPVSQTSTDCNEYVTQIQSNLRDLNPNRHVSHNSSMTDDNTDAPVSQTSTDCNEYVTQIQSKLQDLNQSQRVSQNSSVMDDNTDGKLYRGVASVNQTVSDCSGYVPVESLLQASTDNIVRGNDRDRDEYIPIESLTPTTNRTIPNENDGDTNDNGSVSSNSTMSLNSATSDDDDFATPNPSQ